MARRVAAVAVLAVAVVAAWAGATWQLGGDGTLPPGLTVAAWTPAGAQEPVPAAVSQRLGDAARLRPDGTLAAAPASPPDGRARPVGVLASGPGRLRVAEPAVRRNVAAAAAQVLGAGWRGIHLEITPWLDESGAVLDLLTAVAERVGGDALVSVSVPAVEPAPGLAFVSQLVAAEDGTWQTARSYRRIAQRVDQLVVRTPAGWSPAPWVDGSLARRTIGRAATVVASMRVRLLVDLRARGRAGVRPVLLRGLAQAVDGDVVRAGRVGVLAPGPWLDTSRGRRLLEAAGRND